MSDLDELINELMKDPVFAAEYKKLKPESKQSQSLLPYHLAKPLSKRPFTGQLYIKRRRALSDWQELMESNHRSQIWSLLFSSLN